MAFKELDDHNALLCIKCQRVLLKLKKLEEQLNKLTAAVNQKLDSQCVLDRPCANARKRVTREESIGENNDHSQVCTLGNDDVYLNASNDVMTPEVSVSIIASNTITILIQFN